jgi:Zn-dependent protease with chaperone function
VPAPLRAELRLPVELLSGLYALTVGIARQHRLPLPHEIRLAADRIAHVYENKDGRRILVLGGMAVRTFSAAALGGVIAHELGHFAAGDTTLVRKAWRTGARMAYVEQVLRGNRLSLLPTTWPIRAYHLLTRYLWAVHSRNCEYAADRMSVRHLGKKGAAAALIYLTVCERMPWLRLSNIAQSYAVGGGAIEQIFAEQVERARRVDPSDWQEACARTLRVGTEPFDSHPCLRQRLAAMKISARKALKMALDQSGQPASELILGWDEIEKIMTAEIIHQARILHSAKMELAQIFTGPRRR